MTTLGELPMKKTLLALAVLGAFAGVAHAQSSVTISGNMDMGYQSTNPEGANNNTSRIGSNGSSTSSINFSGTEDLGGGLKAGFLFGTNVTLGGGTTDFGNAQNFVSLGGGFGTFQLGAINTQVMAASSTSQPFGTAFGSAYSGSFSRLDGVGVSTTGVATAIGGDAGARPIRTPRSVYYTSPSFSGVQVIAGMAFENDEGANTEGMQEVAVSYSGNGLKAILAHYKTTVGNNAIGAIPANGDVSQTMLGANYSFGPATIYAGWSNSDGSTGVAVDSTSYNVAGKYNVTPAVALMANYVKVNDKLAGDDDRDLIGLGADYSLSKRTTAYFRLERGDYDKSEAGDSKFTTYALGMRHSF
jgi:predicted porin